MSRKLNQYLIWAVMACLLFNVEHVWASARVKRVFFGESLNKAELSKQVADHIKPEEMFANYSSNIKKHFKMELNGSTQRYSSAFYKALDQAYESNRMAKIYREKFQEFSLESDLKESLIFDASVLGRKYSRVNLESLKDPREFIEFSEKFKKIGASEIRKEFVYQYDESTKLSETLMELELSAGRQYVNGIKLVGADKTVIQIAENNLKLKEAVMRQHIKNSILMSELFFLDHFSDDEIKEILKNERTESSKRITAASLKAFGAAIEAAALDFGSLANSYRKNGVL